MMTLPDHRMLCGCFAELLRYPRKGLHETVAICRRLLSEGSPASVALDFFQQWIQDVPLARQEEIYTATFDLQPHCFPYVGYQLFGEGKQRPMFLVKLWECYREQGYSGRGELPDHLSEMLSFLADIEDESARKVLIEDGILPALKKMVEGQPAQTDPYGHVLYALQQFLVVDTQAMTPAATACSLQEVES